MQYAAMLSLINEACVDVCSCIVLQNNQQTSSWSITLSNNDAERHAALPPLE